MDLEIPHLGIKSLLESNPRTQQKLRESTNCVPATMKVLVGGCYVRAESFSVSPPMILE